MAVSAKRYLALSNFVERRNYTMRMFEEPSVKMEMFAIEDVVTASSSEPEIPDCAVELPEA